MYQIVPDCNIRWDDRNTRSVSLETTRKLLERKNNILIVIDDNETKYLNVGS